MTATYNDDVNSQFSDPEQRKEKTVIYLTRHGFREDWVNTEWKKTAALPFDPPLAQQGLKQAKELGAALAPAKVNTIFSSPYYRCIQTANEVATACSLNEEEEVKICLESGVGERFNEVEAKKHVPGVPDKRSLDDLLPLFPIIDKEYTSVAPHQACHESKEQILDRGRRVAAIISEIAKKEKGTFLIVTHASVLISLVRGFVGDSRLQVRSAVCSVTKLVWDEEKGIWKMKINGDCSHLSEGEQRPYSFSDEV